MSDPLTDVEAAQAFTQEHGFTDNRYGRKRDATITYPANSPKLGKPRCACKTWGHMTYTQCDSVGKVKLADGSTWCGTHAPAAVAARKARAQARSAARQAKWDARRASDAERQKRERAFPEFLEALRKIAAGHNDPCALAREVLGDDLETSR